jgi:hypothetical protein
VTCACGFEFDPLPNKPGLLNQCDECGQSEERERGVDLLVAGTGNNVNGWEAIPKSKNLRMEDVADFDYRGYSRTRGASTLRTLINGTYGDNGR